ncbi:hypothetical protein [Streptomyces sp. AM 2-1-1]|uniref:hypothetical protein n=1 Tax=Streptomyces sp. AM 2-1-1 TaxID=3028709 RepID=UPI0023B9775E|nr:hypothetical protein [Streptomyces sp. AM 2-1-1]WEH41326.1 hypothetical protein PZB77_18500 [Streptomyces sp. AM 2-1-1]
MVRQQVKMAAVLAVVVLALTGFSTSSHGHGGSSHHSGGGGGCSSSKKSNGDYDANNNTYDDDDDDYYSDSSTADPTTDATTEAATTDPTVRVVRCAEPAKGSRKAVTVSTVELTPTGSGTARVDLTVTFWDSAGNSVDTGTRQVTLDADSPLDTQDFTVPMAHPATVDEVYRCTAEAVLAG